MADAQPEFALSLRGLVKRFRDFTLGPIDLDLKPGVVLGLVGPNGAGKTTTLNTTVGLLKHDAGSVEIFGKKTNPYDPSWKFDIAYVGDEHYFYEYWSGMQNLKALAPFYPTWSWDRANELAKRFELDLKKRARRLSKGNRAKLALVGALAHYPKLLLLDEPSSGLDPIVRSEFLDVLWEVNEKGDTAVLYSTHILSDIHRIADELVFLREGKIILRKAKDDLIDTWRQISFSTEAAITAINGVVSLKREGNNYFAFSSDFQATVEHLNELKVGNIQVSAMSIDDIAVQILRGNV